MVKLLLADHRVNPTASNKEWKPIQRIRMYYEGSRETQLTLPLLI